MNRPLPGVDTLPWYRQFWPWFLILLPASVVVAGLYTLYIANRHADDLVVDDYYQVGLAINRQLEKKQRAKDQGISAGLRFSAETVTVTTVGPVVAGELHLLMSHPLEADRDFGVTLSRIGEELYHGSLAQPVAPRWHWTLQLQTPDGWRLDGVVQASDIGNAAID
jgi:hypothetical protein